MSGVDNQYWLELSKNWVGDAFAKQNEAAAKLQTMITWFWSVYTASTVVGVSLSSKSYSLPIILLVASPCIVLILAYLFAALTQMTVPAGFKADQPGQIANAYDGAVKKRGNRLKTAIALSICSAVLVSSAIITASLSKEVTSPNFQASYHAKEGHDIISLSGNFPKEIEIFLQVVPFPSVSPSVSQVYVTPQSGKLQASFELSFVAEKYEVMAEWKEKDGLVHNLKRTLLPER